MKLEMMTWKPFKYDSMPKIEEVIVQQTDSVNNTYISPRIFLLFIKCEGDKKPIIVQARAKFFILPGCNHLYEFLMFVNEKFNNINYEGINVTHWVEIFPPGGLNGN